MCFKEAITPHPTIHFLSKEKFCGIYGKDTFWLWNDVYIELLSCLKKYESFTRQTVTECIKNLTCRGLIVWADFSVACLNNETANIAQTRTNNTFKVKVHSFVQMARCSENVNLCWRICQLVTKRHFSMNDVTRKYWGKQIKKIFFFKSLSIRLLQNIFVMLKRSFRLLNYLGWSGITRSEHVGLLLKPFY